MTHLLEPGDGTISLTISLLSPNRLTWIQSQQTTKIDCQAEARERGHCQTYILHCPYLLLQLILVMSQTTLATWTGLLIPVDPIPNFALTRSRNLFDV